MTQVVERFKTLVPIDNPSGHEEKIREYIESQLVHMGHSDCQMDEAGNLLCRIAGDPSKETYCLSAHMDSVPPCEGIEAVEEQREGRPVIRSAGKTILGADDKSGIAVMLTIAYRLAEEGNETGHPVELLFSTREEIGLLGLKEFDMSRLKSTAGFVLDGEGQLGDIFTAGPAQKNMIFDLTGLAAHAGMRPEKGLSAIVMAAHLCVSIPSGRLSPLTTMNIGTITGGNAFNIVAPHAQVRAECRSHDREELQNLLDNLDETLQEVREHFPKGQIEMTRIDKYDGFVVQETHPAVLACKKACEALDITPRVTRMNIGSDAHRLNHGNIPSVVLGMGFHYSHSLGEFIYTDELEKVCDLVWVLIQDGTGDQ